MMLCLKNSFIRVGQEPGNAFKVTVVEHVYLSNFKLVSLSSNRHRKTCE